MGTQISGTDLSERYGFGPLTGEGGGRILLKRTMDKRRTEIAAGALIACALGGALLGFPAGANGPAGGGAGQELNGPLSREQVLSVLPEARSERDAYAPAAAVLDALRASPSSLRVEAYFVGGDPEQVKAVGRLMKIEDGIASFGFLTDFTAIAGPADPIAVQRALDELPAFIVYVDGTEAGRIAGPSDLPLEYSLAAFLPPPSDASSEEIGDDIYADRESLRGIPHAHLPIDCTRCHRPR